MTSDLQPLLDPIEAPGQEKEPFTLDDFINAIGKDSVPDGVCQLCKHVNVGDTMCCEVTFPNGWYRFWCCAECKDRVCVAMERLMKDLGVAS